MSSERRIRGMAPVDEQCGVAFDMLSASTPARCTRQKGHEGDFHCFGGIQNTEYEQQLEDEIAVLRDELAAARAGECQ